WPVILDQAWAALLYRQNWLLADTAVDYYAQQHAAASPLQHFWSLSIQGQVFILWPLVFAASAVVWRLLRHRYNASYRVVVAAAFAAILVASLAFSIDQTATNQAYAYFDTRTR
ncbi:acyltransferase, partial [Arthrobacter sp. AL08]|nr:acyltransferase [Arthrobacter sp. AL08]